MKKIIWIIIFGTVLVIGCVETGSVERVYNHTCSVDSDCAFGQRVGCCQCPEIFSVKEIESDSSILFLNEKYTAPLDCKGMLCKMCASVTSFGVVCGNNTCRAPLLVEEYERNCPLIEDERMKKECYSNMALAGYRNEGLARGVELCNSSYLTTNNLTNSEIYESEFCLRNIFRRMIDSGDGEAALEFCNKYMDKLKSNCLNEVAFFIASYDYEKGIDLCDEIIINYSHDEFQKNACYHNIEVTYIK